MQRRYLPKGYLTNKLDNVAMVEADHLFRIKPFEMATPEGREQIGRIKLNNTLAVLGTFLKEGFDHIVLDGLVWSQAELDAVVEACAGLDCRVFLFWLKTSKEVRHKRAISRGRDEADSQEFLDEVEKKIPDPTPFTLESGHYYEILTDGLSPDGVVSEMMRLMDRTS